MSSSSAIWSTKLLHRMLSWEKGRTHLEVTEASCFPLVRQGELWKLMKNAWKLLHVRASTARIHCMYTAHEYSHHILSIQYIYIQTISIHAVHSHWDFICWAWKALCIGAWPSPHTLVKFSVLVVPHMLSPFTILHLVFCFIGMGKVAASRWRHSSRTLGTQKLKEHWGGHTKPHGRSWPSILTASD